MAKSKPRVKLPPFPWETHCVRNGRRVRMARPDLEQAEVIEGYEPGSDGGMVARRARVWRTVMPPILRNLNPSSQAAMLEFAEVCGVLASSGGTSDPTGGGGGCAGSKSPSEGKLMAAERWRAMQEVLAGRVMVLELNPGQSVRRRRQARVSYADLVQWVAIDGLGRSDILKRCGVSVRNEAAQGDCVVALAEAAALLAVCCGYATAPVPQPQNAQHPAR